MPAKSEAVVKPMSNMHAVELEIKNGFPNHAARVLLAKYSLYQEASYLSITTENHALVYEKSARAAKVLREAGFTILAEKYE